MAQFQYVDTGGNLQSVEAADAQAALAAAKNIAPNSGVIAPPIGQQAASPAAPGAPAPTDTSASTQAFFDQLTKRLLGETGGTSSVNPVSGAVDSAIKDLQSGLEASQKGIKAKYQQQRDRIGYDYELATTGAREGMMNLGGASQLAILTQYDERNRRALNDLNLAEQQALATGQYEVASKIADLKIQRAQSQLDFEQKTFQNLFQATQLFMQRDAAAREAQQQQFQQKAKMAEIALTYGLKLNPTDTLESVIDRAMPMASEDRKLQLAKIRAEIAATNRSNVSSGGGSVNWAPFAAKLDESRRDNGGYIQSDAYRQVLQQYLATVPGATKTKFDEQFSSGLNGVDRAMFGDGGSSGGGGGVSPALQYLQSYGSTAPTR